MVIEEKITDIFTDPKIVLNRVAGFVLLAYSAPVLLLIAAAVMTPSGAPPVPMTA